MPFGPINLESFFARHVEPWQTLAVSGDQPISILLEYKNGDHVVVYRDDMNTPVYDNTFTADGVGVVELGTANDVLGGDTNLHKLLVEVNGRVLATIPARLYSGDTITFDFKDEEGNELVGDIALVNFDDGTIWRYHGSTITSPVCSNCYVEFKAYKDGKKYYAIVSVGDYAAGRYTIIPASGSKFHVEAVFKVNTSDPRLWGPLGPVISATNKIAEIGVALAKRTILAGPLWAARRISELLGITQPVVDAWAESKEDGLYLHIVYLQDGYQLILEAIAVTVIIIGVGVASYLINLRTIEQYRAQRSVFEWAKQRDKIIAETVEACKEACDGDEQCLRECINDATDRVRRMFGETDEVIKQASETITSKDKELKKWKTIALAAGGGALAVALLTRKPTIVVTK